MRKAQKTAGKRRASTQRSTSKPADWDSFESVAKRLECDEDKGHFEKKLGKIAKGTPSKAAPR